MSSKQKNEGINLQNREKISALCSGGVSLALSFVLSQIKLFNMPMGGTVTPASILPLVIFAACYGPLWGFAVCFVFSLLELIGGTILFPLQVVLDYILPFTLLGISSLAALPQNERLKLRSVPSRISKTSYAKVTVTVLISTLLRLTCSVLSGVIFFAEYANGQNVWIYSLTYNVSFMIPDTIIALALYTVLYGVISLKGKSDKKTA